MNKIVKLTLILFLVSAIVAGVLGLTNRLKVEETGLIGFFLNFFT